MQAKARHPSISPSPRHKPRKISNKKLRLHQSIPFKSLRIHNESLQNIMSRQLLDISNHKCQRQPFLTLKKQTTNDNLYNKYEFLPKIYQKRYMKNNENKNISLKKIKTVKRTNQTFITSQISALNMSISPKKQEESQLQSSSIFDPNIYKKKYHIKSQYELSKYEFSINYDSILSKTNEMEDMKEQPQNQQKWKYKRIQTQTNIQDNSIPSFLMKLINKKSKTNQQ